MKKLIMFAFGIFIISTNIAHAYQAELDGLLEDHVSQVTKKGITYNGVDYQSWGQDARHETVRDALLSQDITALSSKNKRLAYWINTYNVLTIDLIVREGETASIKNLGSTFTNPWKTHKWSIAGKEYTLDDIEHNVIRPIGDARIHFAINCAAISCPDLRMDAYRANKLDAQLEEQTRLTLSNESKGFKRVDTNKVKLSKVMDWFDEDFNNGDLKSWLVPYGLGINTDTNIQFFNYDWALNKQ